MQQFTKSVFFFVHRRNFRPEFPKDFCRRIGIKYRAVPPVIVEARFQRIIFCADIRALTSTTNRLSERLTKSCADRSSAKLGETTRRLLERRKEAAKCDHQTIGVRRNRSLKTNLVHQGKFRVGTANAEQMSREP